MNLLNEDNIVHIVLNKIGDIIIWNLLFVLCSLPLVTTGPALTALYHCTLRTVKGNNNGTVKTFFRAFKQNFFQSFIAWVGILVLGFILFLNIHFLLQTDSGNGKIFFYLSGAILGFLVIITLYIFPVIAAFSGGLINHLKNSFLFAFMHFPSTLAIAVISIFPLYITQLSHQYRWHKSLIFQAKLL